MVEMVTGLPAVKTARERILSHVITYTNITVDQFTGDLLQTLNIKIQIHCNK
jgi:hypothetical protein